MAVLLKQLGASGAATDDHVAFNGTNWISRAAGVFSSLKHKVHAAFGGSHGNLATGAVQTADAAQTTAFTLTLADNTVYGFEANVVARDTAGVERGLFKRLARVHRQGGGGATLGTVQTIGADDKTNAGLDVTLTVSGNDLRVSVTGLAATTIVWVCDVRYQGGSGSA